VKRVQLTRGFYALVNDEDFEKVNQHNWCATPKRYTWVACRSVWYDGRNHMVYMHRVITGAVHGELVDHINGNGLDNQRHNLRICTKAQNNQNRRRAQSTNTSGYRGVFYEKNIRKWRAQISMDNKNIHLGVFTSKANAARVYKRASRALYGEFSPIGGTLQ
jgi:hypothetical protein